MSAKQSDSNDHALSWWTLGRKLSTAVTLVVVLAMTLVVGLQITESRESLYQPAFRNFTTITEMLSGEVAPGARWRKTELMEQAFERLLGEGSELAGAIAFDNEGQRLTQANSSRVETYALEQVLQRFGDIEQSGSQSARDGAHYLVASPMHAGKNQQFVGTVVAAWSLSHLDLAVENMIQRQLIVAASCVVGLLLLLGILITRMVSKPLALASHVAERVAAGDLTVNIEAGARDETGRLLRTLATMQRRLRETKEADERNAAEIGRVKQALDNASAAIVVADIEHKIVYINQQAQRQFAEQATDWRKQLPGFEENSLGGRSLSELHPDPARRHDELRHLKSTTREEIHVGSSVLQLATSPVVDVNGQRLGTVVEFADRTVDVQVEHELQSIVEASLQGDLSRRLDTREMHGFHAKLGDDINALIDVCERVTGDTMRVFAALSKGDLTQTIQSNYNGAFQRLEDDANATVKQLTQVLAGIKSSADSVSATVEQVAADAGDLHRRTEHQAASLEQTAASMEEMTTSVRENANRTSEACERAEQARAYADTGGDVVSRMSRAMEAISTSSLRIVDIISVIDDLAFQTNLLALNASVEAARAGEQGRGFAVVATEVRNLAQRSATSAKEIRTLIEDSAEKVRDGSSLANESGETLQEIVTAVSRVSTIVSAIAAANSEQAAGIELVNQSIAEMDALTQKNAAMVEQTATSSTSMGREASQLKDLTAFFYVG